MPARDTTPPNRPARPHTATTGDPHAADPAPHNPRQPQLRLIATPPASPLTTLVESVEAAYAISHHTMLERLSLVEAAMAAHQAEGALEQIAFMRVGFRCIADAIAELAAHAATLNADHDQPPASPDRDPA